MTRRVCFDARVIRSWDSGVGRIASGVLGGLLETRSSLDVSLLLHEASGDVPMTLPAGVRTIRSDIGSPSVEQHLRLDRYLRREGFDGVFHLHPYSVPYWPTLPT